MKFMEWIKEHKKTAGIVGGLGVAGILVFLFHRNKNNTGSTAPATIAPPSFSGGGGGGSDTSASGGSSGGDGLQSQINQLTTALKNSQDNLTNLQAQLTAMNQADSQTIAGLKTQWQAAQAHVDDLTQQLKTAQSRQVLSQTFGGSPAGTGGNVVTNPNPTTSTNTATHAVGYQATNKWSNVNGTYFVADSKGNIIKTISGQNALAQAADYAKKNGGHTLELALPGQ